MHIVATDDQLRLIDTYDLGYRTTEGPDHDRFNQDISYKSDLYFMERSEYTRLVQERAKAQAQMEQDKLDRKAGLKMVVNK